MYNMDASSSPPFIKADTCNAARCVLRNETSFELECSNATAVNGDSPGSRSFALTALTYCGPSLGWLEAEERKNYGCSYWRHLVMRLTTKSVKDSLRRVADKRSDKDEVEVSIPWSQTNSSFTTNLESEEIKPG